MTPAGAPEQPDLFERIAQSLPAEQRADYWREMAYLKHLDPNDELLRLTRATGYLTQISQAVPARIAEEREQFEKLLRDAVTAIERAHQTTQAYYRKLDERLAKLPAEIAKGIEPEIIAAKITESIRQQFAQTGLPETAQALGITAKQIKQTAGEFQRRADELTNSYNGVAEQARRTIDNVRSTVSATVEAASNAVNHLSYEFSRDYKWSVYTLTVGGLVLGLILGFVLHWWLNSRREEVAPAPAAVVQPQIPGGNAATPLKKPIRKKRFIPNASAGAP